MIPINTSSFRVAIDTEINHLNAKYVMGPTGIGSGLQEFRSVYHDLLEGREDYEPLIEVVRQERQSVVLIDGVQFKVF